MEKPPIQWLLYRGSLLLLYAISLHSCTNSSNYSKQLKSGDTLIIGNVTDSSRNGKLMYWINDTLVGMEFYDNNELNGVSEFYYPNGKLKMHSEYKGGILNGLKQYYYPNGVLKYSDYHYEGLLVGPITFYDSLGYPEKYYFTSLDNVDLLKIDFKKWIGVESIARDLFLYSLNTEYYDSIRRYKVFIYLPSPPKLRLEYGIYIKDPKSKEQYKKQMSVKGGSPFMNLPVSKDIIDNGAVGVLIYDSILKKETIIFKDF